MPTEFDVNATGSEAYAGTFHKWLFRVAGFLACAVNGSSVKYAALLAQADLETAKLSSKAWKAGSGAWCMHYSPTGTPGASGAYGGAEPVAIYGGFFRYWRMWNDRLAWDDKRNVKNGNTFNDYATSVVNAGWFGANATQSKKDSYVASWTGTYKQLPAVVRYGAGHDGGWLLSSVVAIGLWLTLLYLLYLLVRYLLKRRK